MDPAYCVWIPPFAPGQWDDDDDEEKTESENENDETDQFSDSDESEKRRTILRRNTEKSTEVIVEENVSGSRTPVNNSDIEDKYGSTKTFHDCYSLNKFSQSTDLSLISDKNNCLEQTDCLKDNVSYKMVDRLIPQSPAKVHQAYRVREKETRVEKSPSDSEYYDLLDNEDDSDIKFADEDEEDNEKIEKIESSVHDLTIIESVDLRRRTNLK